LPGQVAAYSFDGMMILIKAIKIAGLDREEIQKSLTKIHYEGVSGSIQFDDNGKRIGSPVIMKMKNGVLVIPGKN
jgi:ABC-type branched-subunit amino acid transport system substrate-binding protein